MGGALDRDGGYPRLFARFWAYSSPARWYRARRTRYDLLALCLRHRACGAVAAANVVAAKAKLAKACRWRVTDFATGGCCSYGESSRSSVGWLQLCGLI